MPFEILAVPVLICFVIGLVTGLKQGVQDEENNS